MLIEAYVYSQRKDFVHSDFADYYSQLVEVLERIVGVRLSNEWLSFRQRIMWSHFQSTVNSLLQITDPWAGYLEATLLERTLEESGETGQIVNRASTTIIEANKTSERAHRQILYALFNEIFGPCEQVVTSEELLLAGVDDSKEPEISDYYDDM